MPPSDLTVFNYLLSLVLFLPEFVFKSYPIVTEVICIFSQIMFVFSVLTSFNMIFVKEKE